MSGMNIAFGSLRAFDAAARHGSFRLAAEELNLSPSAVSHAISKLEKSLGALLFDRNGRSLSLTQNGQTPHKHAEAAFSHIRLRGTARSAERRGGEAGRSRWPADP